MDSDMASVRSADTQTKLVYSLGLAQTKRDVLDFRPLIWLLSPAFLDEFPSRRRKAKLRGVSGLGRAFTLHHHELDVYIRDVWEGKFPSKNLAETVRTQVDGKQ